jgi:hypothetical protein
MDAIDLLRSGLIEPAGRAWPLWYLAAYVGLLAWTRRADFRRRATILPATLDVLGSICLSIPALAWLDERVERLCGDALLRAAFGLGLAALVAFTWEAVRKAARHPCLPPPRRRVVAGITLAAALVGAGPDVWWGILALAHASRA